MSGDYETHTNQQPKISYTKEVDLKKYAHFVNAVTSDESKNGDAFTSRIAEDRKSVV